jgi:hypothetical protein
VLISDDNVSLAENIAEILQIDGHLTDIAPCRSSHSRRRCRDHSGLPRWSVRYSLSARSVRRHRLALWSRDLCIKLDARQRARKTSVGFG